MNLRAYNSLEYRKKQAECLELHEVIYELQGQLDVATAPVSPEPVKQAEPAAQRANELASSLLTDMTALSALDETRQREIEARRQECREQREEIDRLVCKVGDQHEIIEAQAQVVKWRNEATTQLSRADGLQENLAAKEREFAQLVQVVQEKDTVLVDFAAEVHELKLEVSQLRGSLADAEKTIKHSVKVGAALGWRGSPSSLAVIDFIAEKLAQCQVEIKDLRQEKTGDKLHIYNLIEQAKADRQAHDEAIRSYMGEVAKLNAQIADSDRAVENSAAFRGVAQDLKIVQARADDLSKQLKDERHEHDEAVKYYKAEVHKLLNLGAEHDG
jgi:chromosome segregation ATPase